MHREMCANGNGSDNDAQFIKEIKAHHKKLNSTKTIFTETECNVAVVVDGGDGVVFFFHFECVYYGNEMYAYMFPIKSRLYTFSEYMMIELNNANKVSNSRAHTFTSSFVRTYIFIVTMVH